MTKISVIVPVYKAEKYLKRCVESILNQTYRNLELILVDDGSPDQSPALCDKIAAKDSRVTVIHQENAGVAAARNAGLDSATGEYITFVDSDDYVDPEMYEAMMKHALEDNCDLVLCDCLKEFPDHSEPYSHDIRSGFYDAKQLKEEYYPHLLIMENIEYPATISNCVMLFRNRNIPRYPVGIRFSEDWLFGAQVMLQAHSFYYMKGQNFYHYCMNPQSATHVYAPDKWNDYRSLHQKMREVFWNYLEYNFNNQVDQALLFLIYNAVGDTYSASGVTVDEKKRIIQNILSEQQVREMFGRIRISDLLISKKQKIITWCYQHRLGLKALVRYYQ